MHGSDRACSRATSMCSQPCSRSSWPTLADTSDCDMSSVRSCSCSSDSCEHTARGQGRGWAIRRRSRAQAYGKMWSHSTHAHLSHTYATQASCVRGVCVHVPARASTFVTWQHAYVIKICMIMRCVCLACVLEPRVRACVHVQRTRSLSTASCSNGCSASGSLVWLGTAAAGSSAELCVLGSSCCTWQASVHPCGQTVLYTPRLCEPLRSPSALRRSLCGSRCHRRRRA